MAQVLITIDTELSARHHKTGLSLQKNIEQSILGRVGAQDFGIEWQMEQMERRGIKGVFFVDPTPALVYHSDCVAQMIEPILRRGHEVQIHIHPGWLKWAKDSPVEGRRGYNIGNFSLADQVALIGWARDALVAAGAPQPTAFRAGNFGANDNTLRALSQLGLSWDSSFNPDYAKKPCKISLTTDAIDPIAINGVIELPVAGIWDKRGHYRPAQVCTLSRREMRQALIHAAATRAPAFVVVSHSFEMLSRDHTRPNKTVMARFTALCDVIAQQPALQGVGFTQLRSDLVHVNRPHPTRLHANRLRTLERMVEQAVATWRFERQLRPI